MRAEQIEKFLAALGVQSCADNGEGWVTSACPLAPFTHKSGKDSHPSFGVTIVPGGHSNFNCYACHSGSLETLIGTIEMYLKQRPELGPLYNLASARDYLNGEEIVCEPLPEYQEFTPGPQAEFEEWPQWYIDTFLPVATNSEAMQYLHLRGVPPAIWTAQDLRWDPKRHMIVAPYRNLYGKLAGARGRCIDASAPKHFRHFDYTWNKVNNADLVWYGEEVFHHDKPIIVVEGQFDRMKVQQVYPTVIAGLSAKLTPFKLKRLSTAQSVIFMLDNDEAGKLATIKYSTRLMEQGVNVGTLSYPEQYKDPDSIPLPELAEMLQDLTNS